MIEFEVYCEDEMKEQIEKALGELKKKTPNVISTAANKTATEARKLLAKMAHEKYSVKKKYVKFQKKIDFTRAKVSKPTAVLKAKGKPLELYKFDVRPRTVDPKRRKAPKGKVLSASSMKSLQTGNLKAFIVRFINGFNDEHITVAQRAGKERLPLKVLYAPSVPTMLASEKNVYGILKVQIKDIYRKQCLLAIQNIINKAGDG